MPYQHPGQYVPSANSDIYQQQQQQQPQQQPMYGAQQSQQQQPSAQQPSMYVPQNNQQQGQQQQQLYPQNQQPQLNQQQGQQQQMYPQQQGFYQGNLGVQPGIPSGVLPPDSGSMNRPNQHLNPFSQGNIDHSPVQNPSMASSVNERYLVGNLSQQFTFQVVQPPNKIAHLGFNGHPLFINGMGFSKKPKFNFDEQNNLLTIISLDQTTVGYYTAVDSNWQTTTTIINAINSSFWYEVL